MDNASTLKIGWGQADITPEQPVVIQGQFHARVMEGVRDPITATVLALESADGAQAVLVSCDLVSVSDALRDAVRRKVAEVPGLDPMMVALNATHTHTAPAVNVGRSFGLTRAGEDKPIFYGVDLPVMEVMAYIEFAAARIAGAVRQAWEGRAPGGVSFGLGHAVVGHNRRWVSVDGVSTMYGDTNTPAFSHIEGYVDHSVNVLCTWDADDVLTGMVVNVPCPSQVSEQEYEISADYWHETRAELRRRFGAALFVLAQCSAAGDQSPRQLVNPASESRMWQLMDKPQRQIIAERIAAAVEKIVPALARVIERAPKLAHRVETVELPRRTLSEADVRDALAEADAWQQKYESLVAEINANPAIRERPRWYVNVTQAYRRMGWFRSVADRYELQQRQPLHPVEVHVLRVGDMAFATNPFEYYLDFGLFIKARSRAVQTFVVQLTGGGTYVPSLRSISGGGYGSVPASTPIGPDGGRRLAERTVEIIEELWGE